VHESRTTLAILSLVLVTLCAFSTEAAAQYRRDVGITLRAKPHVASYSGEIEIVGEVGGQEQYRMGPETLALSIEAYRDEEETFRAQYSLDLDEGEPAVGFVAISELGLESDMWRPALEGLTVVSFLPLPEDEITEGYEWADLVTYQIAEIDLDFAEATQFRIQTIQDGHATIEFSSQGGGSTTIDRPMLGQGAKMDITRESVREGTFVFDLESGHVIESRRIEKTTTTSFVITNGEPQPATTEVQTVTFELKQNEER
jgi:hypothetical protein